MIAGIGVPQITAIMEVKKSMKNKKIKIISDGGCKIFRRFSKSFSSRCRCDNDGSIFAGTDESPGKKLNIKINFIKLIEAWGQ